MTIARFFFKWLWNLINFKKLFKLTNRQYLYWDGANILHGLQGGKVKVTSVHTLMSKNTNRFVVFQDSSIPDVYGDICPCVCDHQTANIAYWHLYWVKNKEILSQIPCSGAALNWSNANKMAAPIQRAVCKDSESEIRIDYPVLLCCIFTITSRHWWLQVSLDDRDSSEIFKRGNLKWHNMHA